LVYDILAFIGMIVPLALLFGASIISMTLTHLVLSATGNQFRVEISGILGLVIFITGEYVMGIFQASLTLVMVLLITPFMILEAIRPSTGNRLESPTLLDIKEHIGSISQNVLCFAQNNSYVGFAAVRIIGIPVQDKKHKQQTTDESDLKGLLPLWEHGCHSAVTYTFESKVEDGLVELTVFATIRDKDWKTAVEECWQSIHVVESWMKQMDYSYEILDSTQLQQAYQSLDHGTNAAIAAANIAKADDQYFGVLTVDNLSKDFSSSVEQLLNRMIESGISGRLLLSFNAAPLPQSSRESTKFKHTSEGARTPYRVEEHQLRSIYKQMAEVEVCEETGAFRAGVSVIIEGKYIDEVENNLKLLETMIKGVWSGVKVTISSAARAIRGWNRFLLRDSFGMTTPVSGARLIGFIDVSRPLPGICGNFLTPEFILPVYESESDCMIPLGYHLRQRKMTNQMYSIHKDDFTTHTLIVGNTGSGKTNTALHLVNEHCQRGVPFLVLSPAKTEWRQLGNHCSDLRIFTAGDESTARFRFNFFEVPPGVPIHTHIDNITTCFIASWPSEGILTEHIAKVFRRVYSNTGWDVLANIRGHPILLTDLYDAMEQVAGELDYGSRLSQDFVGALKARFESLLDDEILSVMFNTERGLTIPELLNHSTILEIRGFSEAKTAFITSLILVGVSEYLDAQQTPDKQELKHLIILEEAHHVLKSVDTRGLLEGHSSQQQAINTIIRLLREARGQGLGLILIDQMPGDLADAAVKLPGITIIHYLKEPRERVIVGGQANLSDEQLFYIGALECGEAIVHQGFHQHAANIRVTHFQPNSSGNNRIWDNHRVIKLMKPFYNRHKHLESQTIPRINLWVPDPVILCNLKYATEDPKFAGSFKNCQERGPEITQLYIRKLVERVTGIVNPLTTNQYVSLLLDYLENSDTMGESFNERAR